MAVSFVNLDRNTPMLLPPDLRDWVDEGDLVHFVIEASERLPLEAFRVNHRGSGSAQMPPHMMLALLVYCYCNGIFSSRKIERATYRDVAVRYLTADTHPDHDTICKFRRENKAAISAAFVDILELARGLGLLKLGKVSTDGTHIKANASIGQNVTYDHAVELRKRLQADIAELMAEAEKADAEGKDDQSLPEEIARREALKSKMDQAIAELESRAAKRREQAQKDYEAKTKAREAQEKESGKKPRGKSPKAPGSVEEIASASNEQCNLTDPDARIMRKNTRSGYTQSYNCQATVDADGSGLIVGQHLTQSASDANELLAAYQPFSLASLKLCSSTLSVLPNSGGLQHLGIVKLARCFTSRIQTPHRSRMSSATGSSHPTPPWHRSRTINLPMRINGDTKPSGSNTLETRDRMPRRVVGLSFSLTSKP